jgi:hypothetical protein
VVGHLKLEELQASIGLMRGRNGEARN